MADEEPSIDRRRAKVREKKLRYRARHPERVRVAGLYFRGELNG